MTKTSLNSHILFFFFLIRFQYTNKMRSAGFYNPKLVFVSNNCRSNLILSSVCWKSRTHSRPCCFKPSMCLPWSACPPPPQSATPLHFFLTVTQSSSALFLKMVQSRSTKETVCLAQKLKLLNKQTENIK